MHYCTVRGGQYTKCSKHSGAVRCSTVQHGTVPAWALHPSTAHPLICFLEMIQPGYRNLVSSSVVVTHMCNLTQPVPSCVILSLIRLSPSILGSATCRPRAIIDQKELQLHPSIHCTPSHLCHRFTHPKSLSLRARTAHTHTHTHTQTTPPLLAMTTDMTCPNGDCL